MRATVQDILNIIEKIAPANLAEEWDNVGLMIGNPSAPVEGVLVGLDPTPALLDEAAERKANLLITHHPFIFHPLKSVQLNRPDGFFIERAIRNNINVIGCHTNLDSAAEGVSRSLARKLGLADAGPMVAHPGSDGCGLGCIGRYAEPVTGDGFADRLRKACSPPWLLATANKPARIECAAVCGGSCSDLAPLALEMGAQVFVTAEVKHSMARWAEAAGLWLIDAGHFATENQALAGFADKLAEELGDVGVYATERQTSPLLTV